jgi:hypothetical protein
MVAKEKMNDEELWKIIPFEEQIEIDIAIDKDNKPEAVNRLMCAQKKFSFNLVEAKNYIERRKKILPKRIPNKKV